MTEHTYEDDTPTVEEPADEPTPASKKRPRRRGGLLKLIAASATGAIAGAMAVRGWDKYVLGRGEPQQAPQPGTPGAPQQNPTTLIGMPMLPMMPPMMPMGYGHPQPTVQRNPEPEPEPEPDDPDLADVIEKTWEAEDWD